MSNSMGEASVNAAMASMQQLTTPVAAMELNLTNRVPNHPPQQKQQQYVLNQQESRRERKRVFYGCVESPISKFHCRTKNEKCHYCGKEGHSQSV